MSTLRHQRRAATALLALLPALGFGCAREAAEPPASSPTATAAATAPLTGPRHLLLTLEQDGEGLRLLASQEVGLPLPRFKDPPREPWTLEVLDASGRALWSAPIPAGNQVRGEIPDERGELTGAHVTLEKAAFPARIPVLEGASTLRLLGEAWTLPDTDRRRAGLALEAPVELGRATLPEVRR